MTVICPQCETRPVTFHGGRDKYACAECTAANHALSRYWIALGMPLSYESRPRMMLTTIRRPAA